MRYGPIYGCYLDREYSTSVGFTQSHEAIREFLFASLLATDSYVYCSLSAIGECPGLAEFPYPFLNVLLNEKLLVSISDYNDPDQFLISRRKLYRDDAVRYPLYFAAPTKDTLGLWEPSYVKTRSSTSYLANALLRQFRPSDATTANYSAQLEDIVRQVMAQRDERAVTIALFDPLLRKSDLYMVLDYRMRAAISFLYTQQFLTLFSGVLMTELPFFQARDRRFAAFRGPNYRIWRSLIPPSWITYSPERDPRSASELLEVRNGLHLDRVRSHIRHIENLDNGSVGGIAYRRESQRSINAIAGRARLENDVLEFL